MASIGHGVLERRGADGMQAVACWDDGGQHWTCMCCTDSGHATVVLSGHATWCQVEWPATLNVVDTCICLLCL
jgi:hypothetical protein